MLHTTIEEANKELRNSSPEEIIAFALSLSGEKILTTSFGRFSAVLLHSITQLSPQIPVIWCDTGYNTPDTYRHAKSLIEMLGLNLKVYTPKRTRAYMDVHIGIPSSDDPEHAQFTEIVKLEPFRRALAEWKPTIWFTNIRTMQTRLRESKDILSYTDDGILKVSPFYYMTDNDLQMYLKEYNLPENRDYYDPVKATGKRECGIHLL